MTERSVVSIFNGRPATDGAGVRMTRVIATAELDHFDPFLLLDEFRSDDPDDYIAGFPDHPHRGFETVTYMLAGSMQHGDNQGNTGLLGPGSVQWMTAGRGIVHSEMPRQEDGLMWGFQLWVNLPASDKLTEPRYQDIAAADIPQRRIGDGVTAKIIAGELEGVRGPARGAPTDPLYLDVQFAKEGEIVVPISIGHNAFVYVYEGEVLIGAQDSQPIARGQIALLDDGEHVRLHAEAAARLILVAGRPLNEPIARHGPFVMNTQEEIRQAVLDYQAGAF